MKFEFSDAQNLLRDQAQSFLAKTCPLTTVRKVLEGKQPFDEPTWRGIAQLGWTATAIPERYEGLGLGYLDTQLKIQVHFLMLVGAGTIFVLGSALFIFDFFRRVPSFEVDEAARAERTETGGSVGLVPGAEPAAPPR